MGLSVVLPCYNEAKSLPRLIHGYRAAAEKHGLFPKQFQLILVDNGSSDETAACLEEYLKDPAYAFLTAVTIVRNLGYGHGLLVGLKSARFDVSAFSHADEQCDPEDVFRAHDLYLKNGAPLVKGSRDGRRIFDRLFSRGFELSARMILGKHIREINAQPKLFPSYLTADIEKNAPKDFAFDIHVLLRAMERGLPIREIRVSFPPRAHGESRWANTLRSKFRHVRLMLNYLMRARQQGIGIPHAESLSQIKASHG